METKWIFQIQHLFPDRGQQAMLYRATLKPKKSHTHGRLLPVPHILRNEDNSCFHVLWWQGYHYGEWLFFKQLLASPAVMHQLQHLLTEFQRALLLIYVSQAVGWELFVNKSWGQLSPQSSTEHCEQGPPE